MSTRRLGSLVTAAVLAASGTYLLVYLYRWEWNRALVAGIFFVAAEIALIGTALLRRLRAIEARLDARDGASPSRLERLQETEPEPRKPFEWLDPTNMSVFVPVLLGAGVILSVLAHGIERLAAATATPMKQRALAARLDALALPAGGLLGFTPTGLGELTSRAPRRDWRTAMVRGFGVVLAGFLLVVSIQLIADATQDRPDLTDLGRSADVVVRVDRRFTTRSEVLTAEAIFVACRHLLGHGRTASDFRAIGDGEVAFSVTPSFGEHAQRKLVGCIEDALFDRISVSVVSIRHRP